MLEFFRTLFSAGDAPAEEANRLERALASLLYEVMRMDSDISAEDKGAARQSLIELLGVDEAGAQALLDEAAQPQRRITSYHDAISLINRRFGMDGRNRLVEHLWRV